MAKTISLVRNDYCDIRQPTRASIASSTTFKSNTTGRTPAQSVDRYEMPKNRSHASSVMTEGPSDDHIPPTSQEISDRLNNELFVRKRKTVEFKTSPFDAEMEELKLQASQSL
jgi:hypothetical protein